MLRRFSFEAGDDADATLSASPMNALPAAVRERLIRKSASMSSLEFTHIKPTAYESLLSPVAQSPTNSAPPQEWTQSPPDDEDDPRKPSRLPTPVYRTSSLARPRRERDDSASSLLTAIKHTGSGSRRSGSVSSSSYSSPCGSRVDLTQGLQGYDTIQGASLRTSGSNRLLDHTNALRGSAFAIAAAKAANSTTTTVDQEVGVTHGQRPILKSSNNSRSSTRSRTYSDMGELRKENRRPMERATNAGKDSNATR